MSMNVANTITTPAVATRLNTGPRRFLRYVKGGVGSSTIFTGMGAEGESAVGAGSGVSGCSAAGFESSRPSSSYSVPARLSEPDTDGRSDLTLSRILDLYSGSLFASSSTWRSTIHPTAPTNKVDRLTTVSTAASRENRNRSSRRTEGANRNVTIAARASGANTSRAKNSAAVTVRNVNAVGMRTVARAGGVFRMQTHFSDRASSADGPAGTSCQSVPAILPDGERHPTLGNIRNSRRSGRQNKKHPARGRVRNGRNRARTCDLGYVTAAL